MNPSVARVLVKIRIRLFNIEGLVIENTDANSRGLYSSLLREKPPLKKLLFSADFIENRTPFIQNSILTISTDPIAKKSEIVPNNQSQSQCRGPIHV